MKALVTGISGQDGHYMARLLLEKGMQVVGLTSSAERAPSIADEFDGAIDIEAFDYERHGAIEAVIARLRPDYLFNFAARTSGRGMFDAPLAISRVNGAFVLEILEAIRHVDPNIRFCQASSAEMFGDADSETQDERTCFRPKSPYGAAKLYAHNLVGIYRNAFGLNGCSAILYNHESIRRSPDFLTRKVARAAASIKLGLADRLVLESIDQVRDWGYAPEYVEAMLLMASAERLGDYVVATGQVTSVERVCEICFGHVGLDYRRHVEVDATLARSIKTNGLKGNPARIGRELGWTPRTRIEQVLIEMVEFDLAGLAGSAGR